LIKNNFIHELNLNIHNDHLKQLLSDDRVFDETHPHHRLVKNVDFLSKIKDHYPFLSPIFNIYKFESGQTVRTHIDAGRYCTINIPICNTKDSFTIFYEKEESAELEYDTRRILNYVNSPVKELFRFTLCRPTLMNTTYPHSVINYGKETRMILSWSILKPITFDECSSLLVPML
jgi:hypothetical protein